MPTPYRRYEFLLPTSFNDGSAVPNELIGQAIREVRRQFGSVSAESQTIEGQWEHEGTVYRDFNARIFVDT